MPNRKDLVLDGTEDRRMSNDTVTITLKRESWENILMSIKHKNTHIVSVGNTWAALQTIEQELEKTEAKK